MEKAYAQALYELVASGVPEEKAFKQLMEHLKEAGRLKLLPQLVRELKREEGRRMTAEPLLEAASKQDLAEGEAYVKKEGISARTEINESLIRGWRLVTNETLQDRSGKRALIDLYRTIVH